MTPEPDELRRSRTYVAGRRAETVALLWLTLKGYRILGRRYAVKGGEIDLIARRGAIVAVVEVKARATTAEAFAALTPRKVARINRALSVWRIRHPWVSSLTMRGDLLIVTKGYVPRHVPDAFSLRSQ